MTVLTFGRVAVLAAIGGVGAGAGLLYSGKAVPWPLDRIPYGKVAPPFGDVAAKPAARAQRAAMPQRPPVRS
jgi:hypothetical protein